MNKLSISLVLILFSLSACVQSQNRISQGDPTRPYSPYLLQRETLDNGFSKGWMPHFPPSEEYWIDMHVHLRGVANAAELKSLLDEWYARLDAYRLGKIVAIINQDNLFELFGETSKNDPRFAWMYQPTIDAPSVALVREAVRNGACALKLHNAPIMSGRMPRNIYQTTEWQAILSYAETAGIPLLWHVTQRHSYSPYHGGGLNAYWADGWKAGVNFTNEDLLQDVLAQMKKYPKLIVIGAHQLHVGLDRLTALLKEYKNLYIESSCGMYLRWADEFIESDRLLLRDFVENWSERILWGTDLSLGSGNVSDSSVETFLCHSRFILKLGLNDKALQDVAWRTAEKALRL